MTWKFSPSFLLFCNFLSTSRFDTELYKKCDRNLHDRKWIWVGVVKIRSTKLREEGQTSDHL
jgi:hypothetical protein